MQKGNISTGLIVIILVVIAIGGYFLMQNADTNGDAMMEENNGEMNATSSYAVFYDGEKFSPEVRTLPLGETITFYNESEDAGMWVASDVHPTHEAYSGTSLDEHCDESSTTTPFDSCAAIQPGEYWTFTFNQVGNWSYHNHVQASQTGVIEVK